jgi:hypothetical protein
MKNVERCFLDDIKLTEEVRGEVADDDGKTNPKLSSLCAIDSFFPHNTSIISLFMLSGNYNCFCSHLNHKFAVTN